jgi:hypothetical protein
MISATQMQIEPAKNGDLTTLNQVYVKHQYFQGFVHQDVYVHDIWYFIIPKYADTQSTVWKL